MLDDGDALRAVGFGDQVGYGRIEPEDARGGCGEGGEGYQEDLAVCYGGGKIRERTRWAGDLLLGPPVGVNRRKPVRFVASLPAQPPLHFSAVWRRILITYIRPLSPSLRLTPTILE